MENYKCQKTTIWSFPSRGTWATHNGDYRGNWSPHVPRNLILKYTNEKDIVLDCFLGSGTTLIECKELNRDGIGVDINRNAINIAKTRLNYKTKNSSEQKLYLGDARNLYFIKDESIDFICTHPPYADIIKYSNGQNINDLSNLKYQDFLKQLDEVSKESFRVLKSSHKCAFMMGDIRKNGDIIPLGFLSLNVFLNTGFKLKEIIIKEQHNCKSTSYWENKLTNFYLIAHEYIFVLYK